MATPVEKLTAFKAKIFGSSGVRHAMIKPEALLS